jgi:periplasmic protein TonB
MESLCFIISMKSITMQTNYILSARLIDIIFDNRNKDYGAYELRNSYQKRISKALLVTAIIAGLAIGGAVLVNSLKKNDNGYLIVEGPVLTEIPPEKKIEKQKELEKPKPQEPQVKTEKFTEFKPVLDEEFETPPPAQSDLDNSKIDFVTKDGIDDDGIVGKPEEPQIPDGGNGVIEPPKTQPDQIVEIVEIDAKFTGNWKQFLEKNLNPNVPVDNSAPAGRYSIVIRFVVDKEGNVSDITPLTNQGYGMEEEAIRVLKKAAKWEPAIQNGIKVKAYRKQVIVFEVLDEG